MKEIYDCHKDFLVFQKKFNLLQNEPLTETDTRSKIIDKIFCEVLDWTEESIDREGHIESGFYDYCFKIPGFGFIVEAKKTYVKFSLPTQHKSTSVKIFAQSHPDIVTQVRKYLFDKSLQYAVITNGHQFVIGKFANSDGTDWKENKCLIFNGFDQISERFVEFYNLLSKHSLSENGGLNVFFNELVITKGRTIISTVSTKDSEIVRNSLSADLTPIIEKLFGELHDVDETINKQLIKECFIENKEIKKHKSEIERLFDDLPPKLENISQARNTESIVTQVTTQISDDTLKFQNPPNPIILVGSKGAGKTTFINYLFQNNEIKDTWQSHPYIYIDFRQYSTIDDNNFSNIIHKDILEQVYEKYPQLELHSLKALKSIYHSEIQRNDQSIWLYDKENALDIYQSKLNAFLEKQLEDPDTHFYKLSLHLITKRRIRLCVVIDNADQFNNKIQEKVFLFAQALNRKSSVTIILSLREGYYYKWRFRPPFNAFPNHVYHITAPPYKEVLQKRIDYALNQLELPGHTEGIISNQSRLKIDNDSVRSFMLSLKSNLFDINSKILNFIQETTYPNIREGLELFKQFLISGHTEVSEYVIRQKTNPDSRYQIPYWEFIKAVALNSRKYYNHHISVVNNLFYPAEGNHNHFTKIKILKFLDHRLTQEGISEQFINTGELLNVFTDVGYTSKLIERELVELSQKRLIETDSMISDTEDESYGINMEASICISMKGHHYINSLIFEFPYIELILQDTPIFDSVMFEEIKNSFPLAYNNGKRDLRMRVEVVEKFLAYLEYTEKSELQSKNILGYDIIGTIKHRASRDMDRIRKVLESGTN